MISENLKSKALNFINTIESNAKSEGYLLAKTEFDAQISKINAEYAVKIKESYNQGVIDGKNSLGPIEQDSSVIQTDPVVNPIDNPIEVPTNSTTYSTEKVKENLLKIKGTKSYIFAILDKNGNAYANKDEYLKAKSPEVLGIGYTDGTDFLCMAHDGLVSARKFGGNGINFGPEVHTTTRQWAKDSKPNDIAAFYDVTGVSNTNGIIKACNDSIAALCRNTKEKGYLPACGELRIFCKYYNVVDELLTAVDGQVIKTIKTAKIFWSSTCKDKSYAWTVRFTNAGDAAPAARTKVSSFQTRIFIEL